MKDGHRYTLASIKRLSKVELKHDKRFAEILARKRYKPSDIWKIEESPKRLKTD